MAKTKRHQQGRAVSTISVIVWDCVSAVDLESLCFLKENCHRCCPSVEHFLIIHIERAFQKYDFIYHQGLAAAHSNINCGRGSTYCHSQPTAQMPIP